MRGFDLGGARPTAAEALATWAQGQGHDGLAEAARRLPTLSPVGRWRSLPGPTGEANLYAVLAREHVLCLAAPGAEGDAARLHLLAAVLAVGARAVWPVQAQALWQRLPDMVQDRVLLAQDWTRADLPLDAVLHAGPAASLQAAARALAARPGPIIGLVPAGADGSVPLERLVIGRSLSVNTAAAGGNASLMTIA